MLTKHGYKAETDTVMHNGMKYTVVVAKKNPTITTLYILESIPEDYGFTVRATNTNSNNMWRKFIAPLTDAIHAVIGNNGGSTHSVQNKRILRSMIVRNQQEKIIEVTKKSRFADEIKHLLNNDQWISTCDGVHLHFTRKSGLINPFVR